MCAEYIAHAKINLALHVTGQRPDGFHLLDTLVVFTQFGDRILLSPCRDDRAKVVFETRGPFADKLGVDDHNLVMQAANALAQLISEPVAPVTITLEKNLPVASGIGGGSADAAATLLALKDFWLPDTELDLAVIAAGLGSDVAMCLHAKPLRAQGIGEMVTPLNSAKPLALVLVNPGVPVETAAVFKRLSRKENPAISNEPMTKLPGIRQIAVLRNDLERSAMAVAPVIAEVLTTLADSQGCRIARMSGSGATCFGVYNTFSQAEAAMNTVKTKRPDWWCVASCTTLV